MRNAVARIGIILLSVLVLVVVADEPDPAAPSQQSGGSAAPSTRPATQPATQFPELAGHADNEWRSYEEMHNFFVRRFVLSEGNGVSRQLSADDILRGQCLYTDGTRWIIGRVVLISTRKPSNTFAYVSSDDLDPRREEMKNYKHVPLSPSQKEAVEKLRYGEQVVRLFEGKHAEVIGAIRMQKSCAECHRARRGDLLGAFSYPLTREEDLLASLPRAESDTQPAP